MNIRWVWPTARVLVVAPVGDERCAAGGLGRALADPRQVEAVLVDVRDRVVGREVDALRRNGLEHDAVVA
jgi:hypothetical protein